MRVLQTVFGVFHHFELARELRRRGHLQAIYSTWPWRRLRREGLDRALVRSFPWLHVLEYAAGRSPVDLPWLPLLPWLTDELGYRNALAFDRWTAAHLGDLLRKGERPDALIAISGSSLRAGQFLQRHGGVFVCDRGSTHQRFQEEVVSAEFRRWGINRRVSDPRDTAREEALYDLADAITVPSSAARRSFLQHGVPANKVHVIPYGVRLDQFTPARVAPPGGEFNVLFAGAVGLRKGVPYLLQAFAALRHPHKRLQIAGAVQAEIRPLLGKLPTEGVEFLGSVSQPALAELMRRSHVLVLPSIEEGLALVQAQAMACSCSVLCSTSTGGEDLFTDDQEGFIVPPGDAPALTRRLQQLADDPQLQHRMRAAALRRVQGLGGWTDYGDRWEALLQALTTRG